MESAPLIPELTVHDARGAIEFYKKAFGATEISAHATPDGKKIMHGALSINGGILFLADDFPERTPGKKGRSPSALGGSAVTIHLNMKLDGIDALWASALAAGATVVMPLANQFWGDRYGILEDPYGHRWSMSATAGEKSDEEAYRAGAEKSYPTK